MVLKCLTYIHVHNYNYIFIVQEWAAIAGLLDPVSLLQKSFVEKCIGQAKGGLVKKNKVKGQQVLRDDASLTKFCDAFRYYIPV